MKKTKQNKNKKHIRPKKNCLFAVTWLTLEKPTDPFFFQNKIKKKKKKKKKKINSSDQPIILFSLFFFHYY